jgi:hypothetical protein
MFYISAFVLEGAYFRAKTKALERISDFLQLSHGWHTVLKSVPELIPFCCACSSSFVVCV